MEKKTDVTWKDCSTCTDETRDVLYECGPETFGKTKNRPVCRNYACSAFSRDRLFPGDVMPGDEEIPFADPDADIPDLNFAPKDAQSLFEGTDSEPVKEDDAPKKKTTT